MMVSVGYDGVSKECGMWGAYTYERGWECV